MWARACRWWPDARPSIAVRLSSSTRAMSPTVWMPRSCSLAAVTGPQDAVAHMRASYDERRRSLIDGLAGSTNVRAAAPTGAFYAFANVAAARGSRDLWALVDDWMAFGVAVLPGTAFGPEYGDWVRLALCTRAEDVAEAARRIAHYAGTGVRS